MNKRQPILLLALAGALAVPASASAAPTVTVTGDGGQPTPLTGGVPLGLRQIDQTVTAAVPNETGSYRLQVFGPDNVAVTTLTGCRDPEFSTSTRDYPAYRGNGTYTILVRYYSADNCAGTVRDLRYQYVVNAGTGVTPPPTKVLTRSPNSLVTNTYQLGVNLNPGAFSYEIRYARGGVVGPDGAISGPSSEAFVNTTTGLADFRFDKPGRYVVVARTGRAEFLTPWSAPAAVDAIAPFDLERVSFPDSRGPSYKIRGIVRERAARGSRVTLYLAKKWRGGKFRKIGRAKVNSKGRFTKRFRQRGYGKHRLRYTFKGNSLVAAGRVTQRVTIRKRFFFG